MAFAKFGIISVEAYRNTIISLVITVTPLDTVLVMYRAPGYERYHARNSFNICVVVVSLHTFVQLTGLSALEARLTTRTDLLHVSFLFFFLSVYLPPAKYNCCSLQLMLC